MPPMKFHSPESDIYGAFINDLKSSDAQPLPPPLIKDLINVARSSTLSASSRATARAEVHLSVMRLIPRAISKYAPRHLPPEEFIGAAFMTINSCIDLYDDEKGSSFPNYVMESLRKSLRTPSGLTDLEQPFYMPLEDKFYGYQIQRSYTDAVQEAQGEPSLAQWYEQTELDRQKKGNMDKTTFDKFKQIHLHMVRRPYLRQGKPLSSGNIHPDSLNSLEGQVEELVQDDNISSNPEATLIDSDTVEDALSQLLTRTRVIVEKQIELDEYITQEELAVEFDVSRGRIGKILKDGFYLLKLYFGDKREVLEGAKKRRSRTSKQS